MKFRIIVFAVLAMIAAPLQAQLSLGKMNPAERDSIIATRGIYTPEPCNFKVTGNAELDKQSSAICTDKQKKAAEAHYDRYRRAVNEAREAHDDFVEWCTKNDEKCREKFPSRFSTQLPSNSSPKPSVTAPSNGIDGGMSEAQIAAAAKADTTTPPAFNDVTSGSTTPSSAQASTPVDSAKSVGDSVPTLSAKDSAKAKEFLAGRAERQRNYAGRKDAQRIADVKVVSGPRHQAFCKGAQTNKTYAAGLRANDPAVINGDCMAHVRAWLHAHPWLGSRVKNCDDLAEYIENLETHPLPLGYSVTTYWVDGPNFGTFDREVKLSAPGVGEVGLYDPVQQEFVGFMGCCNALQGKLIPIGTARPFGSQGMGPGVGNDRFGGGRKKHRGNPNDQGIGQDNGSNTGWWIVGGVVTAAAVTGIVVCVKNHCLGRNENNNDNNNENNNTVRTQKAPSINVPVGFILKILR